MRNTKEIVYERLIKLQHLLHRQQMQKFGGMRGSKIRAGGRAGYFRF